MAHPTLKLVSHLLCPYAQRVRIVLAEKSLDHEIEFIDLADPPDWFLKISPRGKVPVLLVGDVVLFESAVIAEYLDELRVELRAELRPPALHPADPLQRARNRAWIEFASVQLDTLARLYSKPDRAGFYREVMALQDGLARLERALGSGPYFNGAKFSLVDAAFAPFFRYFDVIDAAADFGLFRDVPGVRAWRAALQARPSVRGAVTADYAERLERFFLERGSYFSDVLASSGGLGRRDISRSAKACRRS